MQGTFPFEDEGRLTAQGVEPGSWFYCVYPLFDVIYLNSTDSAQVLDRADSAADIARWVGLSASHFTMPVCLLINYDHYSSAV